MTYDGVLALLSFLFLFPYLMPPVGLLLTSVPGAISAARGASRYQATPAVNSLSSQKWFIYAAANLALHAFFLVNWLYLSIQVGNVWPLLSLAMWMVVQDAVVARAMVRARNHRLAFLAVVP